MMIGKTNAQTTTNFIDVPNDIITITGSKTALSGSSSPMSNANVTDNTPSLCGNENTPIKLKNGVNYYFVINTTSTGRYSITLSENDKINILSQLDNIKNTTKSFNVVIWAGYTANSGTGRGILNHVTINMSTLTFDTDKIIGTSNTNTIRIIYINEVK